MRVVVINHVTLDGVMQGPGRADEDTRDGFEHGGWASAAMNSSDQAISEAMGARMAESDGLLLGRRTYEDLLAWWNAEGGPFKEALNNAPKFVVSTTLAEPLPWPNSTLLGADAATAVGEVKARPGREPAHHGKRRADRHAHPASTRRRVHAHHPPDRAWTRSSTVHRPCRVHDLATRQREADHKRGHHRHLSLRRPVKLPGIAGCRTSLRVKLQRRHGQASCGR